MEWTLAQIAEIIGGELNGPPDLKVARLVPVHQAFPEGISFAEDDSFLEKAIQNGIGAILIKPDMDARGIPSIKVGSPRLAFAKLLAISQRPVPFEIGIHPQATVHPSANVSQTASIGAGARVGANSSVGAGCILYPNSVIGDNCHLGESVILHPGVVLVQDVTIGDRTIIHANSVIGADGFGYYHDGTRRVKIPQVGGVRIGADVEIGACTCVDRAMCGDTIIGDGTKLDNLVQIAHNDVVGSHTVIAGHTSLAGSVTVGDHVTIGGQAAIKEQVKITDRVAMGGRTGVMQDIDQPGEYFGTPAVPVRDELRRMAALRQLPDLLKRVKDLERELEKLKQP